MLADTLTTPPGWEGVAATLAELRANYGNLAAFLDRQWCELEALRGELADKAKALEYRERELGRHEEDVAARLELAEVYKQLAEARCDLLRQHTDDTNDMEETLVAAWSRIEELEGELVSLKKSKEAARARLSHNHPMA